MSKDKIIKELSETWNGIGINKGDMVLVHSSLSRYLKSFKEKGIELTPGDILEVFIECVGEKGTLIFPTFNFEFTKGKTFDIRNTKSETGALTEAARLYPGAVRTGHPLFSFAVIGHHKDKFMNLYNYSAFGKDSPFGILHQMDGKIAVLDIGGDFSMTFYHYIE
ncbi:MAG: AAC(3) family N-acetyltransferase, partial [Ignavibacteria bacterium]